MYLGQQKGYHFGFYFTMIPKEGDLVEIKYSEAFNYIEHEYTWKVTGEKRVLVKLNKNGKRRICL
jgi:hypothetical protein